MTKIALLPDIHRLHLQKFITRCLPDSKTKTRTKTKTKTKTKTAWWEHFSQIAPSLPRGGFSHWTAGQGLWIILIVWERGHPILLCIFTFCLSFREWLAGNKLALSVFYAFSRFFCFWENGWLAKGFFLLLHFNVFFCEFLRDLLAEGFLCSDTLTSNLSSPLSGEA